MLSSSAQEVYKVVSAEARSRTPVMPRTAVPSNLARPRRQRAGMEN